MPAIRSESDTRGWEVAELAGGQHGVVTMGQLRAAGLSASGVAHWARTGRLHRLHRGVYALGHRALDDDGRWMAAVLACGAGAVLSHRSAAELWGLLQSKQGRIYVSVAGTGGRKGHRGLHLHRSRTLTAEAVTTLRGIPITTPARTIADLRRAARTRGCPATVAPWELRRAIRQADVLGLELDYETADGTRSDLELAFLKLLDRHRLPAPEVNVRIGPYLVDFLWRERHLVVETDGFRYHRGRAAFEEDRKRDLELRALGYDVIRLADRQLAEDPGRVASALRSELVERGRE